MKTEKKIFATMPNGEEIYLYTLENKQGMRAELINYGANLVKLWVPDAMGNPADVVLGYDNLEAYFHNSPGFGATIGPNANRIENAKFVLHNRSYRLEKNDGENNLHSDTDKGLHKRVWQAAEAENQVIFSITLEDGELGFPGNKDFKVTYTLTDENEVKITYDATSDKDTIINMTNHSYFNLAGHDKGSILEHILWMKASNYTPVKKGSIPIGKVESVKDTPFDFTKAKTVGSNICDKFTQLVLGSGYDHNWVIDNYNETVQLIAKLKDPKSKRVMEVYTDLPGVQCYTGNFLSDELGKDKTTYQSRMGICLETQFFPDTPNKSNFPSAVFGPEKEYHKTTIYKFI